MLEKLQKNWWLIAVRGILGILFGLVALFSPMVIIFSLLTIFSLFAVLSGVFIVTLAILGEVDNRMIRIIEGIIFIAVGAIVIFNPVSALGGLMIFIAAWAILSGLLEIFGAIKLRKIISNEWYMILNGIISIIFGIIMFANLIEGAAVLMMVFGAFMLLSGIFILVLSFKIKNFKIQ